MAGLLLLVATFAGLQMIRLPFPGLLTEPSFVVNDMGEVCWPAYAAGFSHPQWLVAVDGHPLETSTSLLPILADYEYCAAV